MKKIYISAWFLLAAAALVSILNGSFNSLAIVVFSLIAAGLVYAHALWAVIVNTRDPQQQSQ